MRNMLKRYMPLVIGALLFGGASVGSVSADGVQLVSSAHAAADVQVSVTVARGTKGGDSGNVDKALAKHARTLSRVGGYGNWSAAGSKSLKVAVGKTETTKIGNHALAVTLDSIGSEKAKTTTVVTDSNGKPHKVSSSLGRGGSQVLAVEAADGSAVLLYIVTITY
jgi:hypothetical protein